eukprot:SAG31_NODE_5249_length_2651_cov_1.307602_2_plen_295_part_00
MLIIPSKFTVHVGVLNLVLRSKFSNSLIVLVILQVNLVRPAGRGRGTAYGAGWNVTGAAVGRAGADAALSEQRQPASHGAYRRGYGNPSRAADAFDGHSRAHRPAHQRRTSLCADRADATPPPLDVKRRQRGHPSLGINWDQLGSIGIDWDQLGLIGIDWDRLELIGINWDQLGLIGIDWNQLRSIGINWDSIGINWDSIGINWDRLGSIGINWDRLGVVGINWDQLGVLGSTWDSAMTSSFCTPSGFSRPGNLWSAHRFVARDPQLSSPIIPFSCAQRWTRENSISVWRAIGD